MIPRLWRKALSKESNSLQNHGKKLEKGREGKKMGGNVNADFRNVIRRSSEQVTKNSQSFTKENQSTVTKPNATLSRNGSSNCRKVGSKRVARGFKDKSSDIKADLWWLHLPYVMAVLMQRGSNHEGQGGLYSLKITSCESDPIDLSYTVAFVDHGDSTNFCYLLESFFEDLGDFSADIVPLAIKELHEVVKSDGMKVIVVKKGQLQLYAGQSLADIEMALRSLVESSPNALSTKIHKKRFGGSRERKENEDWFPKRSTCCMKIENMLYRKHRKEFGGLGIFL